MEKTEYTPVILKKNQRIICKKTGDILKIIRPHYRNRYSWVCKKGWFGKKQVLTINQFNAI